MLLQSRGFGDQIIDEFDLLQISPVVYRHGWEYYRVIAFKHKDVKGLLQGFEGKGSKFEVLSKVDFVGVTASSLTLTADALFLDLNEKQIDALLTILAATIAYREKPMPKTLQQEQGSQNDLSRTPQKAENKLVASPVPYVQLFRRVAPEKRNNPNTPRVHYLENNVRRNTWSKDLKDHAKLTSTEKVAMGIILHITKREQWEEAKLRKAYCGDTLDSEGFIHCSTPKQVVKVANALFRAKKGLVLLCIATASTISLTSKQSNLSNVEHTNPHTVCHFHSEFRVGPDFE